LSSSGSSLTHQEPALAALLCERIEREGPLTFRDFMAAALYHPEHGYYGSGRAAIGRKGDYFTSVSVGALYGKLLARQFVEIWRRLGEPPRWAIVEQGAHSGKFAGDVLQELATFSPDAAGTLCYTIVEPSARLVALQQEQLSSYGSSVRWCSSLAELPPCEGVHFSNELLDALPVHRVASRAGEWVEQYVTFSAQSFRFVDGPLSSEGLRARLALLPEVPDGYETEVNLAALQWLWELAPKITCGVILVVDYGFSRAEYYRPERTDGTLTGYANHRRQPEPLARPGEIDLTAHVEFTSIVEEAERLGWELHGFTDQHHLMVGLTSLYFKEEDGSAPDPQELRAFKTLMHPELLGRSFKALCIERGLSTGEPLAGFRFARSSRATLGL
jgi:SAM-dependent MidA family methyltransferase